jgi:hypothetical protein
MRVEFIIHAHQPVICHYNGELFEWVLENLMKNALDAAVASLPDPVNSAHVQSIAETILRTAREGERDPATLVRIALMELQIAPRH